MCKKMGIKKIHSTPAHPQSIQVERFHRYLNAALTCLIREHNSEWSECLDAALFIYRVSTHETTSFSPFEALYGRKCVLPADLFFTTELSFEDNSRYNDMLGDKLHQIYSEIRIQQRRAAVKNKEYHDSKQGRYEVTYAPGDHVMLYTGGSRPARLEDRWSGPYRIVSSLGANKYAIATPSDANPDKTRCVDVTLLKLYMPWTDGSPSVWCPSPLTEHERNLRRQFTTKKSVKIGCMVVVPIAATQSSPPTFAIAQVMSVKGRELRLQWYGNYSDNPLGTHRKGWVDLVKDRHYYRSKRERRSHVEYTNETSKTPVSIDQIPISGFKLSSDDTLPSVVRDMIDESDHYEWTLPMRLRKDQPMVTV